MALSSEISWAGLVRRGPSIVRRLRLASGLVLFSYVFLHFLNHSVGNISWEAMERGLVLILVPVVEPFLVRFFSNNRGR